MSDKQLLGTAMNKEDADLLLSILNARFGRDHNILEFITQEEYGDTIVIFFVKLHEYTQNKAYTFALVYNYFQGMKAILYREDV